MRKTTTRRKANTAMVFNPARGLSIGRSTVRKSAARKNPVRKLAAVSNPRRKRSVRRRNNPATSTGLLVGAFFTAIGVVGFDLAAQRIAPASGGAILRIGIKGGGAYVFQQFGRKIPVIGKYNNEIALVLATMALTDALRAHVLPWVSQTVSGLTGGNLNLLAAPAGADQAMSGLHAQRVY